MSDNMTSEISENALSPRDGADALAALRKAHNPEAEPAANQDPDAEGNLTAVVDVEEPTDQSDSEPEQEEVVSLTLPDGQRINADEAVKGYLRQSDYTKKTQQLSSFERQRQDEHGQEIARLRQLAESMPQETEPDWITLLDQIEPREVQKAQLMWKRRVETKQAAQAALASAERQQLERAFQNTVEVLGSGQFEPKWRDPKSRDEGLNTVVRYGQELGLTRDDLNLALTSPAAVIALEKARRWDALQSSKPEAVKQAAAKPKVFAPGAKPGGKAQGGVAQTAMNRFKQTHSTDDAMATLRALRGKN